MGFQNVEAYLILCAQCGMWTHSRCAEVKRVTPKLSRNSTC